MTTAISYSFTTDEVTAALAEWVLRKQGKTGPYKATLATSINTSLVDGQPQVVGKVTYAVQIELLKK